MIGVLSTVPGSVTRRRCRRLSVTAVIPVGALVALGRPGVSPNIGQSVRRRVAAAGPGVAGADVAGAATVAGALGGGAAAGSSAPHAVATVASAAVSPRPPPPTPPPPPPHPPA